MIISTQIYTLFSTNKKQLTSAQSRSDKAFTFWGVRSWAADVHAAYLQHFSILRKASLTASPAEAANMGFRGNVVVSIIPI